MLTLVIPIYRNEACLPDLLTAVKGLNDSLQNQFEAVFVIDGSPDRCYQILHTTLPHCSFRSKLILLSRNFGSFAAIRAGLALGEGEYFGVMAADLQEPPELVLKMSAMLHEEKADVVIAVREARMDPLLTRLFAKIFWGFYRRYVIKEMPSGGVDIFACNRLFRDQLLKLEERHSSLIAQIFWLGYRREFVSYIRQVRTHGKSAWTFSKKITYLMDSLFSFTDLPIKLLIRIGGLATIFSGILGVTIFIFKLFGFILVPGYASSMLVIIFFASMNLFSLGIVGSYAWRTYENTKARPLHLILRNHVFEKDTQKS